MKLRVPLTTQLRVSLRGLGRVFASPLYAGLGFAVFFLTLGAIVWLPNWQLLLDVWSGAEFGVGDKAAFFLEGYEGIVTNFEHVAALSLVAIALLFGITVALIVAIGSARADRTRSGGGLLAGIIGAGCAACGTSLVAPVLGAIGAGTSLTFVQTLGVIANLVAVVLLGYSIFKLGLQAAASRPK